MKGGIPTGAPQTTIFVRVLQVCESAFPRMQARSRTSLIEALQGMRRKPDLMDHERDKIITFLGSEKCKKHMVETNMTLPVIAQAPVLPICPEKPSEELSEAQKTEQKQPSLAGANQSEVMDIAEP